MNRKLDYIIESDDDCRLVFRFYPRSSSCHSFNEEPPKSWGDVYKVYYSWAILIQFFDEEGAIRYTKTVYKDDFDECSRIDEIAARCKYLAKGKEKIELEHQGDKYTVALLDTNVIPIGMGTTWKILKREYNDIDYGYHISYLFEVWGYNEQGYRFYISQERIQDFGEYLQMCCDYMLEHGEPI